MGFLRTGRAGPFRPAATLFLALALPALACTPAVAQIVLPGATAIEGSGLGDAPPPKPRKKVVPPKSFAEDAVAGKEFLRYGSKGRLTLMKNPDGGYTLKIIAVGEKISKPTEACGLDLGNGAPLAITSVGRPDGVPRYDVAVPGCPLTLDVADGSVLVGGEAACTFQEADCRVDARGLWGPPPADLEPKTADFDGDRSRADKAMRETFKALMARSKDKAELKALVTEQAGFTAAREELCRDYAREPAHGFCGARYTELRAAALDARRARLEASGQLAAPKPKPKPKPVAPVPAASAGGELQ
jgi:uncharacterized protein YecT (DUF1311 family)